MEGVCEGNRFLRELQAIYVMWMRHIKRFARTKGRVAGSILQPALFLIAFGIGIGRAMPMNAAASINAGKHGNITAGITYFDFLVCGLIGMSVIFSSVMAGVSIIWDRQFGFLKEVLIAPVSRLSIVFGRTLGAVTTSLIQAVIIYTLALFMGFRSSIFSFAASIPAVLLLSLFATALGIFLSTVIQDVESFQICQTLIIMPIVFLSTAFIPYSTAPVWIKAVLRLNPVSYGVDGIRHLLIGFGELSFAVDVVTIFIASMGMLFLSSLRFSRMEV